jgi:Trk K+ transport system NAD-binding subunit
VHEIIIPPYSSCAGKHIIEIQWPKSCVISTIRRGRNLILPHGDTTIKVGDVLVVVTKENGLEELKKLCEE